MIDLIFQKKGWEKMAGMMQHQQISEAQQAYDTFWPKVIP